MEIHVLEVINVHKRWDPHVFQSSYAIGALEHVRGTLGNKISNLSYILGVLWLWSLCSCIVLLHVGTIKEKENKLDWREENRVGHNNNLSMSSTKSTWERIWGETQFLKFLWRLCNQVMIGKKLEDQRNHVPIARVIPFVMVKAWCMFLPHTFWFKNCNVYSSSRLFQPSLTHKLVWIMLDCSLLVNISIKCFFISRLTTQVVVWVMGC